MPFYRKSIIQGSLMSEVIYKNGKTISGYTYDPYGIKIRMTEDHIKNMD